MWRTCCRFYRSIMFISKNGAKTVLLVVKTAESATCRTPIEADEEHVRAVQAL